MNPSEKTYYQFNEPQKIIFQSLVDLKCISGLVASDYYKKIEFFSGNFCSLSIFLDYCASKCGSEKLSYDEAMNMAFCLGQQIYHFEKNGFGCFHLDPNKIFVIDDGRVFIYLGEDLKPIFSNSDGLCVIEISTPFSKINRISRLAPELLQVESLPCEISHKCVYYSLGSLIESLLIPLEQLKGTPLVSFIHRSMNKNWENRTLLFL